MKIIIFYILVSATFTCSGQSKKFENWSQSEKSQYNTLFDLAKYVDGKVKDEISKDTLFNRYIYFDYVLNDTNIERRERRLAAFDTLFYSFRKTIDSLGIENLDAKPVRFYKNHKIYEPFDKEAAMESVGGKKMYSESSNVFAYYLKKKPETPLGTLLFNAETYKLGAWIMIDQGGYKYFLLLIYSNRSIF